jgi:hypothetical protein
MIDDRRKLKKKMMEAVENMVIIKVSLRHLTVHRSTIESLAA